MTIYTSMQALLETAGSTAGWSCDSPDDAARTMLSFVGEAKLANPTLQGEIDAFIEANTQEILSAELAAAA